MLAIVIHGCERYVLDSAQIGKHAHPIARIIFWLAFYLYAVLKLGTGDIDCTLHSLDQLLVSFL
jgi:hypothetical protein